MIPREHLPLTLVTFALVGLMFLMYREISAMKTAVAQLSVPSPATNTALEANATDDDDDESIVDLLTESIDDAKNGRNKHHRERPATRATVRDGDVVRASRAVRAEDHEIRPDATDAENALPHATKASVNSSSKDSALKLRK